MGFIEFNKFNKEAENLNETLPEKVAEMTQTAFEQEGGEGDCEPIILRGRLHDFIHGGFK